MALNTSLADAMHHKDSLLEKLKSHGAITVNFRDNSFPFYEKEADDEYFYVDITLEEEPRTVVILQINRGGSVTYLNSILKGQNHMNHDFHKECKNIFVPAVLAWVKSFD